ncbi:mfs monosaccharide transporter [Ceraceosorus bombacis]|uniref:Mfs monosaccharide transporter n=1 Tax=Ceraceosorus bombacis TaxID=401625 RepID=A0A0P1BEH3_9BASI|nr:mfs monosaccharide transporter [Ceraceosorus bombacis]
MPGGGVVPVLTTNAGPIIKPKTKKQAIRAVLASSFMAMGGILFGYDTGTISGIIAMEKFKQDFGTYYDVNVPTNTTPIPQPGWSLSTGDTSLVVSILSAGTFVGALCGAPIADTLGRRWGLQVAMVVFCVGVILQLIAQALPLFIVGRVVAGLGVGIVSTIVPMFQAETAPRWARGAVTSGYQWAITIGLLFAALANNGTKDRTDTGSYRIPIGVQLGFALILSFGTMLLPESPRWFVKKGKIEQAAKSLATLNATDVDDACVQAELADIRTNLEVELTHGNGSYLDCFRNNDRKNLTRTLVGTWLQAWQQLTGINFIFYYGTQFFNSTGAGDPFVFTIVSNVVNVVCTVPGIWAMDRVGRRNILVWGAVWMAIMEGIVAIIGTVFGNSNPAAQRGLVALVCLYVGGFASTWGPAAWVVCGEIFPLAIRAKALSLCTASNWLWNFGIGYATPYLVDSGPGKAGLGPKVFWIWTATCAMSAVFAYFCIVETKGLSLEEVDSLYCTTSPRLSAAANREMRARRSDLETVGAHMVSDEAAEADAAKRDVEYESKTVDA